MEVGKSQILNKGNQRVGSLATLLKSVSRKTKVWIYKAVIRPIFLYFCETGITNINEQESMSKKVEKENGEVLTGKHKTYLGERILTSNSIQ